MTMSLYWLKYISTRDHYDICAGYSTDDGRQDLSCSICAAVLAVIAVVSSQRQAATARVGVQLNQ